MKFSLKWIGDFIPAQVFFDDPKKLAETLTLSGLEVDFFEDQRERFKNISIVEIQSFKKHPQADRLTLPQVFDGAKNYTVICGAKNYKVEDKAILAQPGAIVNGLKIKRSRIRGIESEGMLLSPQELGFPDKEEGIWILPETAPLGQSFSDWKGLNDVIFEIAVPPNRSDCLSHRGLAREIACLFSLPPPSLPDFSFSGESSVSVKKRLPVRVKTPSACPRYSGRLIKGVSVGESPDWLKKKLKSLGLKTINNIVDIANFVLWDRGQPLHTFDFSTIQSLTVDKSKRDEKFLALDECERVLTGEEIVIRDKDRILALAGIIGGIDSGIKKETKDVFIESAFFAPAPIRKTARRYGLETDSSYRFARGIDPLAVKEALDWACFLIQKEAGGEISFDFYDIQKEELGSLAEIEISLEDIKDRLGKAISFSQFQSTMKRLSCKIKNNSLEEGEGTQKENQRGTLPLKAQSRFKILAPAFRRDLKIKEDLIEELARLQGYHKIGENIPPSLPAFKKEDPHWTFTQTLRDFLIGKGYLQVINYSFCDPAYYKEFLKDPSVLENLMGLRDGGLSSLKNSSSHTKKPENHRSFFSINNPLSRELSLMKPLLTPDLFKNVVGNFRHGNKQGRIFELSPVFYQEGESYREELSLGLSLWGEPLDIWSGKGAKNLYQLKSLLSAIFEAFQIKVDYQPLEKEIPFLHPHQSLSLVFKKQTLGFLSTLHPFFQKKYKIPIDVALAEIRSEGLFQKSKKTIRFKPFSKLPSVERDFSFVVPPSLPAEDLRKGIKKSLGDLQAEVEIFDTYEDKGERSLSFRVRLEPEASSWTEEKLQKLLEKAIWQVREKFSISLKQKNKESHGTGN